MTKAEKLHLAKLVAIGCIVCLNMGFEDSPAEVHHIKDQTGLASRSSHYEAIPLCPAHHRTGGPGIAFHATGRDEWEDTHGSQRALLEQVRGMI
jgi:hypothetical protein